MYRPHLVPDVRLFWRLGVVCGVGVEADAHGGDCVAQGIHHRHCQRAGEGGVQVKAKVVTECRVGSNHGACSGERKLHLGTCSPWLGGGQQWQADKAACRSRQAGGAAVWRPHPCSCSLRRRRSPSVAQTGTQWRTGGRCPPAAPADGRKGQAAASMGGQNRQQRAWVVAGSVGGSCRRQGWERGWPPPTSTFRTPVVQFVTCTV